MKITAIVPVHNFVGGLADICRWLQDELPGYCEEHRALIWDDRSEPQAAAEVRTAAERFDLPWTRPAGEGKGSLKPSLAHAAGLALERGHDAVLVCEHDAVPDGMAFSAMLEVFRTPFRRPLASVSPMYRWQGRDAYPTHAHWHTDGLEDDGRRDYPGIGTVADVGAPGVPFLFSLWVPEVLARVDRPEFPDVLRLDGTFGGYLHRRGYHHLRLLDVGVDHLGGGQRTWRHLSRSDAAAPAAPPVSRRLPVPLTDWLDDAEGTVRPNNGQVTLERPLPVSGGGSERGLVSVRAYSDVELAFELCLATDAGFVAKVAQQKQLDPRSDSYHLVCSPGRADLGRHRRVLAEVETPASGWFAVVLSRRGQRVELRLGGDVAACIDDGVLGAGYCCLGTRGGRVELRGLKIAGSAVTAPAVTASAGLRAVARQGDASPPCELLRAAAVKRPPRVSIVTTVYDRVDCLHACLRTVRAQTFRDFEHLVVADHPPDKVVTALSDLVASEGDERTAFANLRSRHDNWGISPAAAGLRLARGRYVCFLSDDNGYTATHLEPLVAALDRDADLGFIYSSCVYGKRGLLRAPEPRRSAIDLGQPLFRRALFHRYLGDQLPFDDFFWDWHLIERFLRAGVTWRHLDRPSFLFKLKDCPVGNA